VFPGDRTRNGAAAAIWSRLVDASHRYRWAWCGRNIDPISAIDARDPPSDDPLVNTFLRVARLDE